MFKNILIPISSEFYNKEILFRAEILANNFKSNLSLIYIIEKKTIDQTDKITEGYLTDFEISQTKKQLISEQVKTADTIIFNDAKSYFKEKNIKFDEKICRGEFSDIIRYELEKKDIDLILMGFEKECLLNYRLLEEVNIPVWIETKSEGDIILAVCSNLAPNQLVPNFSQKLSKQLNLNLKMIYIIDTEDTVEVDRQGKRSEKKQERDLQYSAQKFLDEMKTKNISVEIVKGSIEKETIKVAEKFNPQLIIVGREQKQKGLLGMPVKKLKKKMAEKCNYPILFLN